MTFVRTPEPTVDLIRALFLQGAKYQDIAKQVNVRPNTVRMIIARRGWDQVRQVAKAVVVQTAATTPAIAAVSGRVRSQLAATIEADLAVAAKQRPSLKRQERLEPLVRNAKVALGWGEEQQVLVNISALNPTDPGNAPIDVSSVSTALPLAAPAQSAAGSTEPVKEEPH